MIKMSTAWLDERLLLSSMPPMESQFDNEAIDFIDPNKEYRYLRNRISKGFTLIMKWCLMYHRDPTITDRITNYLKQYPETVNDGNKEGWTPLMISCLNSQTVSSDVIVHLLISHGADLNRTRSGELTALMLCCLYCDKNESTIKLLIDSGADINHISSKFGYAINIVASNGGNETILKMLISAGADVTNKYLRRNNILHNKMSLSAYRLLLEADANPNTQDSIGHIPLSYSLNGSSDIDTIRLFLQYGADLSIKDEYGRTFLDYMSDRISDEVKLFIYNYESPDIKEPDGF
jgi:ankyrin repeat protein